MIYFRVDSARDHGSAGLSLIKHERAALNTRLISLYSRWTAHCPAGRRTWINVTSPLNGASQRSGWSRRLRAWGWRGRWTRKRPPQSATAGAVSPPSCQHIIIMLSNHAIDLLKFTLFIYYLFLAPLLLLELLSYWLASNGHSSVPISGSARV